MIDVNVAPLPPLNEAGRFEGQTAYRQFLVGAYILRDPGSDLAQERLNDLPPNETNAEHILAVASQIMCGEAQQVIRFANRTESLRQCRGKFGVALPNMRDIVESTYAQHPIFVEELGLDQSARHGVPVAPMLDHTMYKYLTHPYPEKTHIKELLDGVAPHRLFISFMQNYTVTDARRYLRGHNHNSA